MLRNSMFRLLLSCSLLTAATAVAQNAKPITNADIIKLIQGGVPEAVIVNKIKASAATLDTSTDAIIALSKAGATEAELAAMTAVPVPVAAPVPMAMPQQPVEFAGGILRRTRAGDPYLQFPEGRTSMFPDGERSNRASLVSFEGKPAIRIPAMHLDDANNTAGNLLITQDRVIFNPYLIEYGWGVYPKHGKYVMKKDAGKLAEEHAALSVPRSEVKLRYPKYINFPRVTVFTKQFRAYDVGWHDSSEIKLISEIPPYMSPELEQFVRDMVLDFDKLIGPFMAAAQITDIDTQLSPEAHYKLITPDDFPKYAALYQSVLDHAPPPNQGPGALAAIGEVMQYVSAGATALQQSNAGGNTVQAQQAAMAQYNTTVANLQAGTPAPASTPMHVSSADTSSGSSMGSAGSSYTGPNAAWVHTVLGTAGAYSCSPIKPPAHPASFTCQRDGEVYKAQQLAWASECSAATGHPDDAVKDASVLMDTLKSAKSLCGAQAPTGPVVCDTDRVLSCSQLP